MNSSSSEGFTVLGFRDFHLSRAFTALSIDFFGTFDVDVDGGGVGIGNLEREKSWCRSRRGETKMRVFGIFYILLKGFPFT